MADFFLDQNVDSQKVTQIQNTSAKETGSTVYRLWKPMQSDTLFRLSLKENYSSLIRPCVIPVKHMMLSVLSNSSCSISKIPEISDVCSSIGPAAKRYCCVHQHRASVQQSVEMHSSLNHYSINVRDSTAQAAGHADRNVVPANQKTTQHLKPHLQQCWFTKRNSHSQLNVLLY